MVRTSSMVFGCRLVLLFGVAIAVASACASSGSTAPAPVPRPGPASPPAVIAPPSAAAPNVAPPPPRAFVYTPGTYRYEVTSDAFVSLTGDSRVDTVSARALVTLRIARTEAGMLTTAGMIDSFTVTSSRLPDPMPAVVDIPFSVSSSLGGQVQDSSAEAGIRDSTSVCVTPVSGVVAVGREILAPFPLPLAPAVEWGDSTITVTCRAALPLIARSIRHSRAEWALVPEIWSRQVGDVAFEVARSTTTVLSGEGKAAGRQVALSGGGQGSSALYVDSELGVLLGGTGNSVTKIVVDAGSQRQEFVQVVHQQFKLRR